MKRSPVSTRGSFHRTVRERMMEQEQVFSNAELKVVRVLLANYPAAGLTTVSRLAKLAGVSDPTVLRLAVRLGYDGFTAMQDALLTEVESHMRSPLTLAPAEVKPLSSRRKPNVYLDFLSGTLHQCDEVSRNTATADYERAVALLTESKRTVLCLGGRFSRFLAGILQRCLHHMRDGTKLLEGSAADLVDELASVGKRHVLVVFDYRRYQVDVVNFASQAKRLGCTVILFTDTWKSPIAEIADIVFVAPTQTSSPFDTLATPLIQLEAIVAGVAERLGTEWRARAAMLEAVRNENHITLEDGREGQEPFRRNKPKGRIAR